MYSEKRRYAILPILILVSLMFAPSAARAADADDAGGPDSALRQADDLYDQGAYARARSSLLELLAQQPEGLSAAQTKQAQRLVARCEDALLAEYNDILDARADSARRMQRQAAAAERRAAEQDKLLARADELFDTATVNDDDDLALEAADKLEEAVRLRARVASERAGEALQQALDYYDLGQYEQAGVVLTRLQEWNDAQKTSQSPIKPSLNAKQESTVAAYLAKLPDATANLEAAGAITAQVEARQADEAKAAADARAQIEKYNQAVEDYEAGRYDEAATAFEALLAAEMPLDEKRQGRAEDYLATINDSQAQQQAKHDEVLTWLDSAEKLLADGNWAAAKEFSTRAIAGSDVLSTDERLRLSDVTAKISEQEQAEIAASLAAKEAQERMDAEQARSEAYLAEFRRQQAILDQQRAASAAQYVGYARADYRALNLDGALANVEQALRHQPDNTEALQLKAEILALQGKQTLPEKTYIEGISNQVQIRLDEARMQLDLAMERGRLAMEGKNYDQAVARFSEAQEIVDYLRPYYDVTSVQNQLTGLLTAARQGETAAVAALAQQKAFESAVAAEDAVRIEREKQEAMKIALFEQANAEFARGKYESAMAYVERILDVDPKNSAARNLRDDAREQIRARTWAQIYEIDKRNREDERLKLREKLIWPGAVIQYPAKAVWEQISNRASVEMPTSRAVLTPRELQLQGLLDQELAGVSLTNMVLPEAIEILREQVGGINFYLDENIALSADILVNLDATDITLRNVLNLILRQRGLGYTIADGGIHISTAEGILAIEAREENLSFRQYDISDLLITLEDTSAGDDDDGDDDDDDDDDDTTGATQGGQDVIGLIRQFTGPGNWENVGVLGGGGDDDDDDGGGGGLDLFGGGGGGGAGAGGLGGGAGAVASEGAGRVMFLRQGYLMVNHVDRIHKRIEDLLAQLRSQINIQVQVEARLITFTDDFFQDIGVDWSGITFNTSRIGPSGFNIPAASWVFDLTPATNVSPALNANLMTLNAAFLDHGAARAVIHAVKNSQHATIVSAPHITAINTVEQEISLSQQGTYVSGYQVQDGIAIPTLGTYTVSDVSLTVRPVVSADRRYVTMDVEPEISAGQLLPQTIIIPVRSAGTDTAAGGVATTISTVLDQTQTIHSIVRVPDRGTLTLGGLSTVSENTGQGSIPILAHIPIIKRLFVRSAVDKRRTHLLFMVTPTIMLPEEIEPQ